MFALAVTLLLLYAGGFTTTIGAGMVFPDWPLSNGSINPEGWMQDSHMRAEHSHRLLGMVLGLLMIALAAWHVVAEGRSWVRKLAYGALVLVVLQGVLGGARVLMNEVDLAIPHAFLAQAFLCLLATIALVHSQMWYDNPLEKNNISELRSLRRGALVLVCLIFVQLIIGAVMRHHGAGLAINTFPMSNPQGDLIPQYWSYGVAIHFAHRVMALLITLHAFGWLWRGLRAAAVPTILKGWMLAAGFLLTVQILLGASVIWTLRMPIPTTLHVVTGALLLCCSFIISIYLYKPLIETERLTCE